MVKRYKTAENWPWLKEAKDGGIVMYDDYKALRAMCDELAADLSQIVESAYPDKDAPLIYGGIVKKFIDRGRMTLNKYQSTYEDKAE